MKAYFYIVLIALFTPFAMAKTDNSAPKQKKKKVVRKVQDLPNVKLVSITPDAEKTIAYVARVSNPKNQENKKFAGLIRYCVRNGHWSILEQAFMTLEIETTLPIATQILRHRSFTFQQFSQRYAAATMLVDDIPMPHLRMQDYKNRQNSLDKLTDEEQAEWHEKIKDVFTPVFDLYKDMLDAGIAKECARFLLPQATPTRLYMSGTIRSWAHYIELRTGNGTQKEHMDVAEKCKAIFIEQLPIVAEALGWIE